MGSPQSANFCSNCGSAVEPDDAFCSNCGAAVGGSAVDGSAVGGSTASGSAAGGSATGGSRIGGSAVGGSGVGGGSAVGGSATDGRSLRRRVEDLTIEGWEVERDYGDRVVLVNRGFGSVGVHAFLAVFTGGLGNVAYGWYNYSPGADRIELRSDGTERYLSDGASGGDSTTASGDTNAKTIAASVFFALVGLAILDGVASLAAAFLGITFILAALFTFPPTRERLRDRKPVTTFGQAHSTDEEVVTAPDQPCTACSRPVGTGVKRTYRERTYLAGIPITTTDEGENVYCRSCANGDPFTTTSDEAGRETEFEL